MLLTLTENIFIQSELGKRDRTHILDKRTLKLLTFWIQFFQRVRFLNKNFKTRQILIKNFYKASGFGLRKIQRVRFCIKKFGHVRFWKIFACKKTHYGSFYSKKTRYFAFLVLFQKHDFEMNLFKTRQISI